MKKFLKVLFNIFWVLIVGLSSAISSAIMGVACMATIIGIPFGLQHFKYIKLVFAPAGKKVVTKYGTHPVMNTLWLLLGGLEIFLIYVILGCVLSITIVGIPLALQLFKIAEYNLAPFGAEIIGEEDYSSYGDTASDISLLNRRIIADPDKIVSTDEEGKSITARQYFVSKQEEYYKQIRTKRFKLQVLPCDIIPAVSFFAILIIGGRLLGIFGVPDTSVLNEVLIAVAIAVPVILFFVLTFAMRSHINNKLKNIYDFKMLEDAFPAGSPQINEFQQLKYTRNNMTLVDNVYKALNITYQPVEKSEQKK